MHTADDILEMYQQLYWDCTDYMTDSEDQWLARYEDIAADQGAEYAYQCMLGEACAIRDEVERNG